MSTVLSKESGQMIQMDPAYIQVSRKEAAKVIGRSVAEFDRLRKSDPQCPQGFRNGQNSMCPLYFRLLDVYEYSQLLMERAQSPATE